MNAWLEEAWETLKGTVNVFREEHLGDWAAALTYYGLLSLFPATLAVVSMFGLFADSDDAARTISNIVNQLGPDTAAQTFSGPVRSLSESGAASVVLFAGGLAAAVWSASGYVGAFMRASNEIYDTAGRSFWRRRYTQTLLALAMLVLAATVLAALVLSGPLAAAVGGEIGLSETAVDAWQIGKWPFLFAVVISIVAILYYVSPDVAAPRFQWVSAGSLVAVVGWLVGSYGFTFYVTNFGSYDKTYGAIAGVIVLLVWLWLTNLALLFGHALNAVRRGRRRREEALQ